MKSEIFKRELEHLADTHFADSRKDVSPFKSDQRVCHVMKSGVKSFVKCAVVESGIGRCIKKL